MSFSPTTLARRAAERPRRVLAAWGALFVIAIAVSAALLGGALTSEQGFRGEPESQRVEALVEDHFGSTTHVTETVLVRAQAGTIDDAAVRNAVRDLAAGLSALGPDAVLEVRTAYDGGEETARLATPDRRSTLVAVTMAGDEVEAQENVADVIALVERADAEESVAAGVTGQASIAHDIETTAERDLQLGELIGLPIALLILLLVFRSLIAALVPVGLAIASIVVAIAAAALIGSVTPLSFFVVNMITMMGLAVGVDYALFVVSRYRDERAAGSVKQAAIATSAATAGRAVLFSGITVVVALVGMLIVPTSIFFSLAMGAILVVLVAMAASVTLLPALLSVLGDRIDALRLPLGRRGSGEGRVWNTIVGAVMRRPAISLAAATALLLAAAVPYVGISTGSAGVESLPANLGAKQTYEELSRDFGAGAVAPVRIAIEGDVASTSGAAAVSRVAEAAAGVDGLGQAAVEVARDGRLAVLTVPLMSPPQTAAAQDAVFELRDEVVPEALAGTDLRGSVGGETATNVDFIDISDRYLPIVFGIVLVLSFVVLLIAFRSLVVPLTAIAMNLLSVGAAYGLLVLVAQEGFGSDLLGFQQVPTIEAWIPLFLFSILFGLSMDYHVFLLSRIRERFDQTGDTADAVRHGISSSARLITGAALIMVAVFAGFAAGDLVMFQQMGFGLAVAILIDATIVRSVMVPATMRLLGEHNWYLPRSLGWLPRISVEAREPAPGSAA